MVTRGAWCADGRRAFEKHGADEENVRPFDAAAEASGQLFHAAAKANDWTIQGGQFHFPDRNRELGGFDRSERGQIHFPSSKTWSRGDFTTVRVGNRQNLLRHGRLCGIHVGRRDTNPPLKRRLPTPPVLSPRARFHLPIADTASSLAPGAVPLADCRHRQFSRPNARFYGEDRPADSILTGARSVVVR